MVSLALLVLNCIAMCCWVIIAFRKSGALEARLGVNGNEKLLDSEFQFVMIVPPAPVWGFLVVYSRRVM